MKKIILLLVFWFFYPTSYATNKIDLVNHFIFSDSTETIHNGVVKQLFKKGMIEYEKHNYTNAISIWKDVLKDIEGKKDSINLELSLKTKVNIGATYNALGYHKTAAEYFLTVKSESEQLKKNDRYWINNINIGVCYMSLEQYDLAKKYFDDTKDYNSYIIFLKNLNLAKWHGLNKNKDKFLFYQKSISKQIVNFSMYQSVWEEMQLEFFTLFKDKESLNNLLNQLIPRYKDKNLFLKLQINTSLLFLKKNPVETVSEILNYNEEVINSDDFYLKNNYFNLLKEFFYKIKNIQEYYKYDILLKQSNEDFVKQKNMLYVEDFKAAYELEHIKDQFSKIQLEKEVVEVNLTKSKLRFNFSLLIIALGIIIIILIIRNYKKNKKIDSLNIVKAQNQIEIKETEKKELTNNLKETADELYMSVLNIKKVALLKKQLENIVDEKDSNYEEKETLKKLKLCLNSFFDNYRELTQIMQKKLNVDKIFDLVKNDYPAINENELQVIEYIILQFTTKEIAILMDKSEKTVEYYRSQIRKKIILNGDLSIEEHLFNLVN